ncbi:MAG: hypothetical protein J1F17_03010 [Oscillospiraceae bacterium]|nr:hypothetical protein [Oscillospiraceae bacterium]
MADILYSILDMSFSGSFVLLAVLVFRFVLKRAPKWINFVLWTLVGIRLTVPISIESIFSLIPKHDVVSQKISVPNTPVYVGEPTSVTNIDNVDISHAVTNSSAFSFDIGQIIMLVWLVGIGTMITYMVISFLSLKNKLNESVHIEGNIWECDRITSPFIFGFVKPKIYLPCHVSSNDKVYVIAHEKAHIKRKDYFWRVLGFFVLAVHWFNPLVWYGYIMLCKDIEIACDERVIRNIGNENKKEYSKAIIDWSTKRFAISACPIAFGEVAVKARVKNVLNYKKPAFWIIIAGITACILTAVFFMTSPLQNKGNALLSSDKEYTLRYAYKSPLEPVKPGISINTKDKTFIMSYSVFSSYIVSGKYSISDNYLYLKDSQKNFTYRFKIKDDKTLIFDKNASSKIPDYKYGYSEVPRPPILDGAEFNLTNDDVIKAVESFKKNNSLEGLMDLNGENLYGRTYNLVRNYFDKRMESYSNKNVDYTGIVKRNCEFWDFIHYYDNIKGKSSAKRCVYEIKLFGILENENSSVVKVDVPVLEKFVYSQDDVGYVGSNHTFTIEKVGDEYLITDDEVNDKGYKALKETFRKNGNQ